MKGFWLEWLTAEAPSGPEQALHWVEKAVSHGENLLAIEIAEKQLQQSGTQGSGVMRRLRQQLALALSRAGFQKKAMECLSQLQSQGMDDAETLGLLGRIYKDLAGRTFDAAQKKSFMEMSCSFYRTGFVQFRDPYCGINAAALNVLLGMHRAAMELADETLAVVSPAGDYWALATAAESHLIRGRLDQAEQCYRAAICVSQGRLADIAATRKQCRLLCAHLHQADGTYWMPVFLHRPSASLQVT